MDEEIEKQEQEAVVETVVVETVPPVIEHLVLAGGGMFGFQEYGALRQAAQDGFWDPAQIKSIWGTSAGSIVGVMVALGFDWATLDDFLIRRPWHTLYSVDLDSIMAGYANRGIINQVDFVKVFVPLFASLDIPLGISLQGMYEWSCRRWPPHGIDLHIFAIDINQDYSVDVDFNRLDFPAMPVLDAVYASCSIPGVFSPLLTEAGNCYLDGGAFANFPLLPLLKRLPETDPRTVFGITRDSAACISQVRIGATSNLFELYTTFLGKVGERISRVAYEGLGAHVLPIPTEMGGIQALVEALRSADRRRELIDTGVQAFKESGLSLNKNNE
jgi:predicted acylesterase/phospholipase RssA